MSNRASATNPDDYDPMPEPLGEPVQYGPPRAMDEDELDEATTGPEKRSRGDDDDEDRRSTRRRVMSINQVIQAVARMGAKATKEDIAEILTYLDKRELKKIRIDQERRQRRQHGKNDRTISEVYSPPRMTKMARKYNLVEGIAMDLTTVDEEGNPWDFTQEAMRNKAEGKLDSEQPGLLILCPPCTGFCVWQHINYPKMPLETVRKKLEESVLHVGFAMRLAVKQADSGRKFIYEHPIGASSWGLQVVREVA